MTSRRAIALTSSLAIGALGLAGCSGTADEPTQEESPSPEAEESQAAQPSASPEPEGDVAFTREDIAPLSDTHFGDVVWATETDLDVGLVRGDRVIGIHSADGADEHDTVVALDADGEHVWSAEYDSGHYDENEGAYLNESFAVPTSEASDAQGLLDSESTSGIELLSYADGSVVGEFEDVSVDSWLVSESEEDESTDSSGIWTTSFYDASTGEKHPYVHDNRLGGDEFDPTHILGVPNPDGALTGYAYRMRVPDLGLALLTDTSVSGSGDVIAVDESTGKTKYEITCGEVVPTRDDLTSHDGAHAKFGSQSPNGQYAVSGNVVLSATEGYCYGDEESGERAPEFTAVDDDGRAFGMVGDIDDAVSGMVVADFGAEGSEVELVEESRAPRGIVDGGLAVFEAKTETGDVAGLVAVELR